MGRYRLNFNTPDGNPTPVGDASGGVAPEVMKLAGTITKQNAKLGQQNNSGSPSILNRIFDVVSRPLYASANAADYAVKGDDPLTGAWRGLEGKDKTTYDQVLADTGMKGGWQRSLAGFGLDVGLDPTTYMGLGFEKGVTEGAIRKTAVEAAGREFTSEGGRVLAKDIASKAAGETAADLGVSVSSKEAKSAGQAAVMDHIATKTRAAEDAAMAAGRGKLFLKLGGRDIVGSEKLGGLATDISRKVGGNEAVQGILKAFRPKSTFQHGTHDLMREAVGHSFFEGEQALGQIKDLFKGVPEGERQLITHSIEDGRDLSGMMSVTGKPMEEYRQTAKTIFDKIASTEEGMGILNPDKKLANYVPHFYDSKDAIGIKAFKKERALSAPKLAEDASALDHVPVKTMDHTLKAAADAGLKPETDIVNLLGQRTIKSFREQAQVRFATAVENEFGIHLGSGATKEFGASVAKKDTERLANKMGLVEGTSKYLSGKGIYFHPDVASVLNKVGHYVNDPAAGSELGKMFDKVQQIWKLNMTALNPGHHVRNFAGDVFLNLEDGVANPLRYADSAKILNTWKDDPAAFTMRVGDRTINGGQIMDMFSAKGGKSGFFRTELTQSGIKPIEKIREMAETREDWTRLAHFVDVLKKEGKNVSSLDELDKVASEAGRRVRKFNIDYGDLTPFERNTMKRIVPFYTWIRKNIPVQLETLAMNPGKIALIPKGLKALQGITGQTGMDPTFMGLNLTPKWLREMAGVRVAGEGQGRNGLYWNPSVIPFSDISQYSEGGVSGILSSALGATNPLLRMGIEQATGKSLYSGGNLPDTGMGYAGANILPPSISPALDIARGQGDAHDIAKLLGLSLYDVGPQQQLGELRRQQDPIQQKIRDLAKQRKKPANG